jgi:uncharacterized protein (TIGR02145 family)
MKDHEGNIYKTIQVGSQTWMAENLKVVTYLNGDSIVNVTNNATWAGMGVGAYSYNNNNPSNNCPYGKLYNWYAVNDSRKICPSGWHVPSDLEWNTLISVLDGAYNPTIIGAQSAVAATKMKSTGVKFWVSPNSGANNESGFSALPGGYRKTDGVFASLRTEGYWWTSSTFDNDNAIRRGVSNFLFRDNSNKRIGFSVRCIKD